MSPEIINLLSSDPEPEIPSSSAPAAIESNTSNYAFLDFSDEIDFLPLPKRRRLTPEPPPGRIRKDEAQTTNTRKLSSRLKTYSDGIDAIILSSSPAAALSKDPITSSTKTSKAIFEDSFLGSEDSAALSPIAPSVEPGFSSRTTALLAKLNQNRLLGIKPPSGSKKGKGKEYDDTSSLKFAPPSRAAGRNSRNLQAPVSSIENFSSQPQAIQEKSTSSQQPHKSNLEHEHHARKKAEERGLAKAQKATERAIAKEAKAREKQLASDLAAVNRAHHDKKISVREMVVLLPKTMSCGPNTVKLAEEVLSQLGVQVDLIDTNTGGGGFPRIDEEIVSWKRKVRARYDEEAGHWIPLERPETRIEASHVLCVLEAKQFARMVQNANASDQGLHEGNEALSTDGFPSITLTMHAEAIAAKHPSRKVIYLIEGLEIFMRKNRNARNRKYQAAARAQAQPDSSSRSSKRKAKSADPLLVDDDVIEDALLQLQVEHNCLIHHTQNPPETAEWIGNFTQHVSTIPYKKSQRASEATFCMDVGQVKTGDDKDDTFVKMLQEIVRLTLPVAYGITAQYPTVISLFEALKRHGPLLLQDLKKCSNKNGSFTEARIGPALSRRVYKIFMGADPDSMDV